MINPNILKYVFCELVSEHEAIYRGQKLSAHVWRNKKLGKRRLYLKYSIVNDRYYLTDRA